MKMKYAVLFLLLFLTSYASNAQQKWNLRTVVDYAMANNIAVKQSEVQARVSELIYKQSKLSRFPTLGFNSNAGLNSGNAQDPVTFARVSETFYPTQFQLQSSADIFNFYSKRNTIEANKWELEASRAQIDKLKNDIALTAANGYLQVLLAKEQENVTNVQLKQTQAQLSNTRKLVDAGALPELNASQLEAQLALDSGNYISARGNVSQAILLLKSYMNIDAAAPFEVDTPPVEAIPVEPISDLQPDYVYKLAITNQPLQKVNDFRIKAAEKSAAAAKGAMYPNLTGYAGLGSSYVYARKGFFPTSAGPLTPSGLVIETSPGVFQNVLAPSVITGTQKQFITSPGFGTQFSDNFSQSLGVSLNVPIFNGGSLRTNYKRSQLNIVTQQLQKTQDDQNLKQDIYQAYNAATIALEKFNASKKTVAINETTFNYATKRFDVGMLSTFDLITTQNNLLRAKLEYTINQFDYVFKMKVLEFYKGQGLKL
ncbi:MAG: TolC family protein [Ferruginibacter sp.]